MSVSAKSPEVRTPAQGLLRRYRRFALLVGVLAVLAWQFPRLVATTPLRNLVFDFAGQDLPDGVSVGSASLSWNEPVQLNDVTVQDDAGHEVLRVERIESDRTLWELTTQRLQQGMFRVFRPRLTLTVRENSTTLDPAIQQLLGRSGGSRKSSSGAGTGAGARAERRGFEIDLANGELIFVDERGNLLTRVTDIVATFQQPKDAQPGRLHVDGRFVEDARLFEPVELGRLLVDAEWSTAQRGLTEGHVEATAEQMPLRALGPLLRRTLNGREFDGAATLALNAAWQPAGEVLDIDGDLTFNELAWTLADDDESTPDESFAYTDSRLEGSLAVLSPARTHIDSLEVTSELLQASVTGEYTRDAGTTTVALDGDIRPAGDWWRELLPSDQVIVNGPAVDRIRWQQRTSESIKSAQVAAGVNWDQLAVAGFLSQDGNVEVRWRPESLAIRPESVPIAGGRFVAGVEIGRGESGTMLTVAPGVIAEDLQLTPDMCRGWLKYVSPLLADATEISGAGSVATEGFTVPLNDLPATQLRGELNLSGAQVMPGALARQISDIVTHVDSLLRGRLPQPAGGGPRRWMKMESQLIEFEVADRRVRHDRITYLVDDVPIVTSGSVGFDESLDLILEVPLQRSWLGSRNQSLTGQSLRIPVRGTLRQPMIDTRPLADLNRRLAEDAVQSLIRGLLD